MRASSAESWALPATGIPIHPRLSITVAAATPVPVDDRGNFLDRGELASLSTIETHGSFVRSSELSRSIRAPLGCVPRWDDSTAWIGSRAGGIAADHQRALPPPHRPGHRRR